MKKWVLIAILPFLLSFGSCFSKKSLKLLPTEHLKYQLGEYYIPIPIQWQSGELPYLKMSVENKRMSALLDLGFTGSFELSSEILQSIRNKKFRGISKYWGVRGSKFEKKSYLIPPVNIQGLWFSAFDAKEISRDFEKEALIVEGTPSSFERAAVVGWNIFKHTNLFLNLAHSEIAFCDHFQTLQKWGIQTVSFVKVPLLLDRKLIEFEAKTKEGPIRCTLDTGSTWNLCNCDSAANFDPDDPYEIESLRIGNKEFGPLKLYKLPIRIPIQIDALLGVEFFKTHQIYIDFSDNTLYIARSMEIRPGCGLQGLARQQ